MIQHSVTPPAPGALVCRRRIKAPYQTTVIPATLQAFRPVPAPHARHIPRHRLLRLHHRRRRLRRLPARQPALRRSTHKGARARSRRQRPLDLAAYSDRLPLHDRRPALRLVLPDASRAGPQRPLHQPPARQGDRRLVGDQRHVPDPRPGRRLRPLAPARARRLGLGRRAALLQGARGFRAGCQPEPRRGRGIADRGIARTLAGARCGRARRARSMGCRSSTTSIPATTRVSAPSTSRRKAGAAGAPRPPSSSRRCAAPTSRWRPRRWPSGCCSKASVPSASNIAKARTSARRAPPAR